MQTVFSNGIGFAGCDDGHRTSDVSIRCESVSIKGLESKGLWGRSGWQRIAPGDTKQANLAASDFSKRF